MRSIVKTCLYLAQRQPANADLAADEWYDALNVLIMPVWLYQI